MPAREGLTTTLNNGFNWAWKEDAQDENLGRKPKGKPLLIFRIDARGNRGTLILLKLGALLKEHFR
jgi:hypothetical protein